MIFQLTLNMASNEGRAVHQITVEHGAKSLAEFCEAMQANDFMYFDSEYYKDGRRGDAGHDPARRVELRAHGAIVVSTAVIGKVRVYVL